MGEELFLVGQSQGHFTLLRKSPLGIPQGHFFSPSSGGARIAGGNSAASLAAAI